MSTLTHSYQFVLLMTDDPHISAITHGQLSIIREQPNISIDSNLPCNHIRSLPDDDGGLIQAFA